MKKTIAILLIACFTAVPAWASDIAGKWGLGISGGFDTYSMSDINNKLAKLGGSLTSGYEAGGEVTYGATSNILASLGLSYFGNNATFNAGTLTEPALSVVLKGAYVVPDMLKSFDLRLGLGVEFDSLNGAKSSIDPTKLPVGAALIPARHSSAWTPPA